VTEYIDFLTERTDDSWNPSKHLPTGSSA